MEDKSVLKVAEIALGQMDTGQNFCRKPAESHASILDSRWCL
jgi:hypothetical protein